MNVISVTPFFFFLYIPTWYPIVSPTSSSISWATRFAMLTAASLLGYVHNILHGYLRFKQSSSMYFGTWVVFPQPVSPETIRTYFCLNLSIILVFSLNIGRKLARLIDSLTGMRSPASKGRIDFCGSTKTLGFSFCFVFLESPNFISGSTFYLLLGGFSWLSEIVSWVSASPIGECMTRFVNWRLECVHFCGVTFLVGILAIIKISLNSAASFNRKLSSFMDI